MTSSTESSGRWRAVLLAAVAACAACGIIYELALLTLSASLNGGGIVATSLIVAGLTGAALATGANTTPMAIPASETSTSCRITFPSCLILT